MKFLGWEEENGVRYGLYENADGETVRVNVRSLGGYATRKFAVSSSHELSDEFLKRLTDDGPFGWEKTHNVNHDGVHFYNVTANVD